MNLGLTNSQKQFRPNVIGGSDANTIMSGNPEYIYRLWQEKRRLVEPENLDNVLAVRMGQWTEELNRIWFHETTQRKVTDAGEERLFLDWPVMAATVDGLTLTSSRGAEQAVFEAKHVSAFAKEDEIFAKYQPQLHHNMTVFGLTSAVLSVFIGTLKHVFWDISFDAEYAAKLYDAERDFWDCVQTGREPCAIQPPETPKQKAALRTVTLDMTENEDWEELAKKWTSLKPHADKFDSVSASLKAMVDIDVAVAQGHGIILKIDKANRCSIKPLKEAA